MAAGQPEVVVRIQCRNLPGTQFEERTGLWLGIQQGREVVDDVAADTDSVTFTVPLRVGGRTKNGPPNFLGAFAQGTPEARFVYLCWGTRDGGVWHLLGRAKIPLKSLDWQRVEQSLASGEPMEITVDMTDRRGGPACGTLPV